MKRGLLAVVTAAVLWPAPAPSDPAVERQVMAACLVHFTQYVKWPEHAFASAEAPLVIGVLGRDPFGEVLDQLTSDEVVRGRRVVVRRYATAEQARECHVLFLVAPEAAMLTALGNAPVLTVSAAADFSRLGGAIQFVVVNHRVRFDIRPAAIEQAGLRCSSQLLKLARAVLSPAGERP